MILFAKGYHKEHTKFIDNTMFFSPSAIQSWLWDPLPPHASRSSVLVRAVPRIIAIFLREFQRDNISLRAGALTFTIVLSLVPTLALGTAVLKGLGAGDQMRQAAYKFIDSMEVQPVSEPHNAPTPRTDTSKAGEMALPETPLPPPEDALTGHLRRAADQIFDYVDRTDFATLGAFGIIGLVFSVLSVLGSIEQSMNVIWQAESGRPFGRKLMDYLALMILLPLSVNLALATETTLQNKALFQLLNDLLPIAWITAFLLKILPMILVIATFTILYRFLPNMKVRMSPALIGGLVGGLSWLFTQTFYLKLQIGVARYNAIYGSFATLPLFLVWLYIGWLIFLAGAEVAFSCQNWRTISRNSMALNPRAQLSLACEILEQLYDAFQKGRIEDAPDIAESLEARVDHVQTILTLLAQTGLIHHVTDTKETGYAPAIPQAQMDISLVVDAVLGPQPEHEHHLAAAIFTAARNQAQIPHTIMPMKGT